MNLIYLADPMCSWCYGFAQTLDALLAEPGDAAPLQLALVMGGLRPFTTEPLAAGQADEIAGHWHVVAEACGQPASAMFAPKHYTALHEPGFVYDTEPASRAVVTVRTLKPQAVWRYFKSLQQAFYFQALNITRPEVLADLAEQAGVPRSEFAQAFASQAMRDATAADFLQAQDWGIRGFPAMVAEHGDHLHVVCNGYAPIDELRAQLQLAPHAEPPR